MTNSDGLRLSQVAAKRFPFPTSIIAWVDLLGYGKMIAESRFNPLDDLSKSANTRLKSFHEIVAKNSQKKFPTLVLNDGAIAYRDLSYRTSAVTFDFLKRSYNLLQSINDEDVSNGYPGARMVIAAGFRVKGRKAGLESSRGQFESILTRLSQNKISKEQAIHEAKSIRPTFDIVPQLQTNFAFTKAYLAEQSGSKAGFSGSHMFVDCSLFELSELEYFDFEPPFDWEHPSLGLGAKFIKINHMSDRRTPPPSPPGFRDGVEIAEHLAGTSGITSKIMEHFQKQKRQRRQALANDESF